MAILLVLIPISLVLLGLAVWAFAWAVRGGQYDDLDSPAIDILRNDAADALTSSRCGQERGDHAD
jgi:cbb3-type cytochrome oxidase maturation protein